MGSVLNKYTSCGRICILNAASLPAVQDNSCFPKLSSLGRMECRKFSFLQQNRLLGE